MLPVDITNKYVVCEVITVVYLIVCSQNTDMVYIIKLAHMDYVEHPYLFVNRVDYNIDNTG